MARTVATAGATAMATVRARAVVAAAALGRSHWRVTHRAPTWEDCLPLFYAPRPMRTAGCMLSWELPPLPQEWILRLTIAASPWRKRCVRMPRGCLPFFAQYSYMPLRSAKGEAGRRARRCSPLVSWSIASWRRRSPLHALTDFRTGSLPRTLPDCSRTPGLLPDCYRTPVLPPGLRWTRRLPLSRRALAPWREEGIPGVLR
mmetsp:Transcript_12532/g.31757  ORF Transcript_12532/g.31757 Transcript_12532/m.31757 type:complete len:202 (+) Transcript_12532:69-674(+)